MNNLSGKTCQLYFQVAEGELQIEECFFIVKDFVIIDRESTQNLTLDFGTFGDYLDFIIAAWKLGILNQAYVEYKDKKLDFQEQLELGWSKDMLIFHFECMLELKEG